MAAVPFPTRPRPRQAFALVLVLFLVVLLSTILIAYMTITKVDLQTTQSYSQDIRAEQIARGAFENIKGQIIGEIAANSTRYGSTGLSTDTNAPYVYWPKSPANMVLQLSPEISGSALPLVKISGTGPFFSGGTSLASTVSSTTPASNGPLISLARWNKPQLCSTSGSNTWPSAAPAPNWIYVTRAGPQAVTDVRQAANAVLSNTNFVLGRYAYAIYDVSGLLDITAAGYTTTGSDLTQPFISQKGYLALADLTQLPGVSGTYAVTNLVKWRNQATLPATQNYLTTFVSINGGLTVSPGDNTFINRQDLINYAQANSLTNALPYLTTFHRSLNAPSFSPDANLGSSAYKDNAFPTLGVQTTATNCCIPNMRVQSGGWKRLNDDGTTTVAVAGEPLINKRFPLSRLALFTGTAPDPAKMLSYFGLTEGTNGIHDTWTYTPLAFQSGSSHICLLSEVAAQSREPNFFELLKSVILAGSLGRNPGKWGPNIGGPWSDTDGASNSVDVQVMRIGVNIIDQSGSNNYPTSIYCPLLSSTSAPVVPQASIPQNYFYGIKNLPYLQRVTEITQDDTPPKFDGTVSYAGVWLQPILWNPNQTPATQVPGPTTLRVQAFGNAIVLIDDYSEARAPLGRKQPDLGPPPAPTLWSPLTPATDGTCQAACIQFSAAQDFATAPVPLTQDNVSAIGTGTANLPANDPNGAINWPTRPAGIALPRCPWWPDQYTLVPGSGTVKSGTTSNNVGTAFLDWDPQPNVSFAMQWLDPDGVTWHTYQVINKMYNPLGKGYTAKFLTPTTFGTSAFGDSQIIPDPRTDRLGTAIPTQYSLNTSLRPDSRLTLEMLEGVPTASGFSIGPAPAIEEGHAGYIGNLTENLPSPPAANASGHYYYYQDKDGIIRGADGAYSPGPTKNVGQTDGYFLATTSTAGAQRSIILNRPFHSVGELGYAFRDLPFKTLDFFTENSADTGLLDVFSVDTASMGSGKVNINRAPAPVVQAVLSGGLKRENDPSQLLSTDVNNIARRLIAQLAVSPMIHRGNLVWSGSSVTPILSGTDFTPFLTSTADESDKTQREAAVRSLAEVADPRTWNLLIDVVAQAGRYPPQAGSLSADFQVQAEKRYWLHLAIDRITGQIVASQLEPVYE